MKFEMKQINLVVFLLLGSIILISMFCLKPVRRGDGNEYFLMLQSLSNHLSPDLQQRDINDFYTGELNAFGEKIDPHSGYYEGRGHKWYNYHFWAYSLSGVPVKSVIKLFGLDTKKSLQITNALLFLLLLIVINFFSKLKEGQKFFFMLLLTFSPALWFIHWPHAEIFILTFVTISLILLNLKKYGGAIVFAAIASFQNQVLVLFVLFLLIKAVLSSKDKGKTILKYGALSSLIILPNLFYIITFGRFNLLSEATSLNNISVLRAFELFFDLNIGLLPYVPLSLFLFLGVVFYQTYKQRGFVCESQILLLITTIAIVCSSADNWNHGTSGPSRYVIWIFPFIFFILTINLYTISKVRVFKYLLITAVFLQFIIVALGGVFVHEEDYLKHTSIASFVLNKFPVLYNPSTEIFCERTRNIETEPECVNPTIYRNNNECKKALLTCEGLQTLQSLCNNTDKRLEDSCKTKAKKDQWFYVNY